MSLHVRILACLLVASLFVMGVAPMNLCLFGDGHVAVDMGCQADCRDAGMDAQPDSGHEMLVVLCNGSDECLCIPIPIEIIATPATISTKMVSSKIIPGEISSGNQLFGRTEIQYPGMLSRARTLPMRMAAPLLDLRTIVLRT